MTHAHLLPDAEAVRCYELYAESASFEALAAERDAEAYRLCGDEANAASRTAAAATYRSCEATYRRMAMERAERLAATSRPPRVEEAA